MAAITFAQLQQSTNLRESLSLAFETQASQSGVDRLPSTSECAVHLELLEAIVRVEAEVAAWGKEKGLAEGVAWRIYGTAAAKRFLKWSRLNEANKGNTPPLDILIVWHAYMLNTAAYRQYETETLDGRMGLKGINWAAVHCRIDEDSGFKLSAEDSKLPFPADLLGALRRGEVQGDTTGLFPPAKFDMVAAVERQLKFAHKMHDAKWLHSPFASKILETAISRYEMFFTLIAEHPGSSLSPTPDIDLVWHIHQLSPKRYGLYSAMKANGRFVNHNDSVGTPLLQGAFDSAKTLFRERFGSDYQVCYCEGCMVLRAPQAHFTNEEPADCSGDSCIPQTCSNSCKADCSGDSCQSENA